jgi:hypothetical protein
VEDAGVLKRPPVAKCILGMECWAAVRTERNEIFFHDGVVKVGLVGSGWLSYPQSQPSPSILLFGGGNGQRQILISRGVAQECSFAGNDWRLV